jgi:septum site-determining protein MinD
MGKTTVVAAVSSCLAALGHKTLCIDFDMEMKNLDLALCLDSYEELDLADLLEHKTSVSDACREHPKVPNLFFLSAQTSRDLNKLDIIEVMSLFNEIRREFDYCLIDSPAGISAGFRLAHAGVDMSIIITSGELPSLRAAQRAASLVLDMGVSDLRLLVNRVQQRNYKRLQTTINDIIDAVGVQLIGVVPEDEAVFQSLHEKTPLILYRKRRSVYDFLDIARRIAGEDVPWRTSLSRNRSLFKPAGRDRDRDRDSDLSLDLEPESPDKPPEKVIGPFGVPDLWAKSTLEADSTDGLVKVYEVKQGSYVKRETVRYRTWLHDVLDDYRIPYYVDVSGYWATRRKFVEAQQIFVQEKHKKKTQALITEYNDPGRIVQEYVDGEEIEEEMKDGILQKQCQSCNKMMDFDHHKCPYCKAQCE